MAREKKQYMCISLYFRSVVIGFIIHRLSVLQLNVLAHCRVIVDLVTIFKINLKLSLSDFESFFTLDCSKTHES